MRIPLTSKILKLLFITIKIVIKTEINVSFMSIPDTGWSLETAHLPAKLKLSFSARVIMTDNISVFD